MSHIVFMSLAIYFMEILSLGINDYLFLNHIFLPFVYVVFQNTNIEAGTKYLSNFW